jgi:hypothetical protein
MLPTIVRCTASNANTRFEAGSVTKKRFVLELKTIQLLFGYRKYSVVASVRVYRVRGREIFPAYAVTARLIVALWLSEPDEPVKVREAVVADTYAADVKVSCPDCPGVTSRLVGETDTPDGRSVTPIVTGEVNPLEPVTVTEAVAEEPEATVTLELETARPKSGLGGGVVVVLPVLLPPPQPATIQRAAVTNDKVAKLAPLRNVHRIPTQSDHLPFPLRS